MLESLRSFLSDLAGGDKRQAAFAEDDYRLAAAALLVHVCTVDGDISPAERARLHDVLKHRFDLDEGGTARLTDAAIAADNEGVDLYHFTHLMNRALDKPKEQEVDVNMRGDFDKFVARINRARQRAAELARKQHK